MIATLFSFASQFKPELVARGRALFDEGGVGSLVNLADDELIWRADIADTKVYKEVTIRLKDGKVTDIFCPCGPAVCKHVIAMLFALQERLQVTPEAFDPAMLAPEPLAPHVLLGRRLNDIIHSSRMDGSKNGELEKMGATVNLKEPDVMKLRGMVQKGWFYPHEKTKYPILNGAKKLLGAAILKYEKGEYEFVFAIARAILTEICSAEISGASATECAAAAIELMSTLCTAPEVPLETRKVVLERVAFACKKELYSLHHSELLDILCNPSLDKELQEMARVELKSMIPGNPHPADVLYALHDLLAEMDREEELEQLIRDYPAHFQDES